MAFVETRLLERMSSESDDQALRVWFLIVVKLASVSEKEMLIIASQDRIWAIRLRIPAGGQGL